MKNKLVKIIKNTSQIIGGIAILGIPFVLSAIPWAERTVETKTEILIYQEFHKVKGNYFIEFKDKESFPGFVTKIKPEKLGLSPNCSGKEYIVTYGIPRCESLFSKKIKNITPIEIK